jgi:gamma-glutamyltranspeptidase/glutathione hydrolase
VCVSLLDAAPTPVVAGRPPGTVGPEGEDLYAPAVADDEHGTTHYSIVDSQRNAVSFTSTIEANFGSGVVVRGTGMLLNNELTDFEPLGVDPDTGLPFANGPEGGKKPRRTALGEDAGSLGGKRPRSRY